MAWPWPWPWPWPWLLCCCCLGRGDPGTWPPSGQRQAAAFRESLNRHRYLNSFSHENSTAFYGINQFSHLFPEEFKATYLSSKTSWCPRYPARGQTSIPNVSLPLRFDWRDKHVVTKVRNQQVCGGCWAFSVVGAVESVYAIQGEPLEELSVQQVIDCSFSNCGCRGGSPLSALSWLNKTQVKLVAESEYPFKAENGLCHYFSSTKSGVSIKNYSAYDFSEQEDEMARALLSFGPLIVVVDAVSWQDYLGGIIQHHCSSGEANHAVLITGFDKTGNTPYWMVRNSWGDSWGVDGYAHVKMGGNICGAPVSGRIKGSQNAFALWVVITSLDIPHLQEWCDVSPQSHQQPSEMEHYQDDLKCQLFTSAKHKSARREQQKSKTFLQRAKQTEFE